MSYFRLAILALLVGAVLAVASVYLAGIMAALPIPVLATPLPVVLLAWLVGHVMVRATRRVSLLLFVGSPWVILGLYDRVSYLRNCGATLRTAVSILLSGHYLEAWSISLLSIPVGLGLAWLIRRRHARR